MLLEDPYDPRQMGPRINSKQRTFGPGRSRGSNEVPRDVTLARTSRGSLQIPEPSGQINRLQILWERGGRLTSTMTWKAGDPSSLLETASLKILIFSVFCPLLPFFLWLRLNPGPSQDKSKCGIRYGNGSCVLFELLGNCRLGV